MLNNLFNEVCDLIDKEWIYETEDFQKERQYQLDLTNFLRKELNRPNIFSSKNVTVTLEGQNNCDIAINRDEIGIELKKDLHNENEINRLWGQLDNFTKTFDDIIVVLVGNPVPHYRDLLKQKIVERNQDRRMNEPYIEIIYPSDEDDDKGDGFPVWRI